MNTGAPHNRECCEPVTPQRVGRKLEDVQLQMGWNRDARGANADDEEGIEHDDIRRLFGVGTLSPRGTILVVLVLRGEKARSELSSGRLRLEIYPNQTGEPEHDLGGNGNVHQRNRLKTEAMKR